MDKKKYYVSLQSREISQIQYQNNDAFTVYATPQEIQSLRQVLDNVHSAEVDTYWRAHVPIVPYHNDPSNDRYDKGLTDALSIIYELGDEQARAFIEESGILSDRSIDTNR